MFLIKFCKYLFPISTISKLPFEKHHVAIIPLTELSKNTKSYKFS